MCILSPEAQSAYLSTSCYLFSKKIISKRLFLFYIKCYYELIYDRNLNGQNEVSSDRIEFSYETNIAEGDVSKRTHIDSVTLSLTIPNSGLKKWIFHKTDPDPFPSIPHGDSLQKEKLDVYTGYIFYKRREINREKKKDYDYSLE